MVDAQIFHWQARTAQGDQQQGWWPAHNLLQVRAQLLQQGLQPLRIQVVRARRRPCSTRVLAQHTRQLATLLQAGVPLLQALEMHLQHSPARLAPTLYALQQQVRHGVQLHTAMQAHPHVYPKSYRHLVAAGEASGQLTPILQRLATDLEQSAQWQSQVRAALFYPCLVVVVATLVVMGLLTWVVPGFADMFKALGANLPTPTVWLMAISQGLQSHLPSIGLGWLALLGIAYLIRRRLRLASYRLPWLGGLLRDLAAAQWARTLATLLAAGLPLLEALPLVHSPHLLLEQANAPIRQQLLSGHNLQQALSQHHVFPPLLLQMVAIGEASGTLESMLHKAAETLHTDSRTQLQGLSTLLEPLLMVVLGLVVGAIVLALYLPIFTLGQAL